MSGQTAKIINLEDYLAARALFRMEDIKGILNEVQSGLRTLDDDVTNIILRKHKLKEIEPKREKALKYETVIKRVSYFLKDKMAEADNARQKELLEQCKDLKSINDDLKKTIADDIATCRYNEKENAIDWMKAAGFLIGTPVAVSKFVEAFITSKPDVITHSGEAGAALGLYLAFNRQANALGGKALKQAMTVPRRLKIVHRSARNAAFAITMSVSVAAKQNNTIEPREPARLAARQKMMIVSKM